MISVNHSTYVISIPKADLTLVQSTPTEIRSLDLNTLRLWLKDWEDSDDAMPMPDTHSHNTTITVGGVTLARVLEMLDPYTITFEDGAYAVNLTSANSNVGDKVNVNSVSIRSANSAGLIQQSELDSLKYAVESLRISHQGFGVTFYVSTDGSDSNSGRSPTSPKRTLTAALALCVAGRGDVVNLLTPGIGEGVFEEAITIDAEDVHLRGPGRGVCIWPTAGDGITINGDNCSLSGIKVRVAAGSSHDCIVINGRFSKLRGMYPIGADTRGVTPVGTGNCIHYRGGDYHTLEESVIEGAGGSGILFTDAGLATGAPREVKINNNQIYYNRHAGVHFTGASSNSTRLNTLELNQITHNSMYGVHVGVNCQRNMIMARNYIKDNATFPSGAGGAQYEVFDEGTDTMVDLMPDNMAAVISSALASRAVEGGLTQDGVMRLLLSAVAGKMDKTGDTLRFKSVDGLVDRIVGTVDASGNRTGVTLNGSG